MHDKFLAAVPAEWKFADSGAGDGAMLVEGYGAYFNNIDGYGDVIVPGAFADTLAASQSAGKTIPMLYQHQSDKVAGIWTHLAEDGRGLAVKGRLLPTTLGRDTYIEMKEKAVTGLSIGFTTLDSSPRVNASDPKRTIKKVHLWEVSPVTFPANDKARVTDVKSAIETIRDFERLVTQDADLTRSEFRRFILPALKACLAKRDAGEAGDEPDELAEIIRRNTALFKK